MEDKMTKTCEERCIAKVNGKCVAEKCVGALTLLGDHPVKPEKAAMLYQAISTMFQEDFPEENEDKEE